MRQLRTERSNSSGSAASSRSAPTLTAAALLIGALLFSLAALAPIAAPAEETGPLAPSDTSSPRAALKTFLEDSRDAIQLWKTAIRLNEATPGLFASDAVKEGLARARSLGRRAANTMDLSQIPQTRVEDLRIEATLLLKEVLDRIELRYHPCSRSELFISIYLQPNNALKLPFLRKSVMPRKFTTSLRSLGMDVMVYVPTWHTKRFAK